MIEGQEGVTWDDWIALASACEEHGVEGLFRSDHYISWSDDSRRVLDAWATLAGLAARTTRLELGTLVSPATFRHPSVLARNAATVDEISGGRVTLGLGAGWQAREHEAYGFEFGTARDRVARLGEQLEIVHRLLREDRVTFEGSYYKLVDAPGLGRPDVNLLVGGSAKPGTADPAARFADEYNTLFAQLDELRERQRALDEACQRVGRDPATLRRSLMAPVALGREGQHAPVGTVAQLAERLEALEEIGYERVMLQHLAHKDLDTVALIGRELAPAVA
jgi:F420-dependent oxidoreductase-like protein